MDEQPRYRTHISLAEIQPSPTNPRKHFDEAGLAELAISIKEHGVITPILIRLADHSTSPSTAMYELISGERRWRAAQIAGLRTIPAVIRDDLSPAAIIEIQLIENLQRQDLHPLEEAEGYGRMMREHGYTADTLAEKIGKSRSYIFGRMKLLALSEEGRRLFYGGLLNPSTALLVARIPTHKLQAKAIEDITSKNYYGEPKSVREAQRWIRDRYMLKLDEAPFPSEDGELIATAGPCSACPKRTGNEPELFDDIDSANVCTDPDCFAAKKVAALERRAKAAGPDVKVVTGEEAEKIMPGHTCETRTHAKLDSICYDDPKHRTYREILGDDQSAVTLVENAHKAELVPVVAKKVITEKLKAQGIVTQAQETRDENKKIKAQVVLANTFRDRLFKAIRESKPGRSPQIPVLNTLIGIVTHRFLIDAGATRGENVASLWGAIGQNSWDRLEAFRKGLANYEVEDQLGICLDLALLAEHRTDEHNLKREPEGMLAMAKALDIDADALLKEVKDSLKPVPKPAKKSKKTAPAIHEDHLPPTEAAQARGDFRAEEQAGANEAAQAGDQTPLENPTAEEPSSAAGAAVEEPLSSASDEANEKPSVSQLTFAVGDSALVREGMNAGKVGVIDCIYTDDRAYPYALLIDGHEFSFSASEIEPLEKAIESNAKPSPARKHTIEYQHPENAELCWSGRGRKPKWVEHWIAGGKTLDQLKIRAAV